MAQQQIDNPSGGSKSQETDDPPAPSACDQCRNRKVRCDRQLPQCSSCERAGVLCEFPTRGKRVNPVKQLVEAVSSLAARLDSIDSTILSLVGQVHAPKKSLSQTSNAPSQSEVSSTSDFVYHEADDIDLIFSSALDGQAYWSRYAELHNSSPDQESQTMSGTSIGNRALLEKVRQTVHSVLWVEQSEKSSPKPSSMTPDNGGTTSPLLIANAHPTAISELKALYQTFPTFDDTSVVNVIPGEQYVSLPPQSILDASLQLFLEKFNSVTPIFNEIRLRESINAQYSCGPHSKADEAYNLCFNNIIVLSSGLRARLARQNNAYPKGMNEELLPAFLANSFRALQHVKFFLQPRHVNLQALATLALVAREYHESHVFDMVCHMACDLFKAMDSEQCPMSKKDHPNFDEWRTLYWTLFVMDKQRTSVNGQPFDLYFYHSDLPLTGDGTTANISQQSWMMHIYITTIWEETYISLYSARAARKGNSYRENQVIRLDKMARKWHSRVIQLFPGDSSDNQSAQKSDNTTSGNLISDDHWRIELKYAYHVGHILIHSRSETSNSKDIELENAKAALRIIRSVLQQTPTEGSLALLCRLLRSYPLIAAYSVCMRFFENPSMHMLEDLDLMESVRDAYNILVDPNVPICSTGKTYLAISWCVEVAQVFGRIIFDASTPLSSTDHRQQGASRKRPTDAVPSSSTSGKAVSKRMRLNLTDNDLSDHSSISKISTEKRQKLDLFSARKLSGLPTPTEEVLDISSQTHVANKPLQQSQLFNFDLSTLPNMSSQCSSTDDLSLVTDSIPTLSLNSVGQSTYPITQLPPPPPGTISPLLYYTEAENHPSGSSVANPLESFLDYDSLLQQNDNGIGDQYMPDDISRWLLQLAHRDEQ